eukprot:jgi/Mesen1/5141/ME000255S04107
MKITVKTLKGNHFDLQVESKDLVSSVKTQIEEKQGRESFPSEQQLLIHKGKVMKDETSLEENSVEEAGFIVVMLTKHQQEEMEQHHLLLLRQRLRQQQQQQQHPERQAQSPCLDRVLLDLLLLRQLLLLLQLQLQAPGGGGGEEADVYSQAASNLVAGNTLDSTVQHLVDMGGGSWDRDTVVRALRAAFNNPERAVEYLYSGIPEGAEAPPPVTRAPGPAPGAAVAAGLGAAGLNIPAGPAAAGGGAAPAPSGPNAAPLDLFPQGMPGMAGPGAGAAGAGALDFLRNNPQFQALRQMVQANPQILQPMLQELGKQNPQEAMGGQFGGGLPQAINVTPEEKEAIDRLEGMGFERALVIEAFFACDKNEQLAANYLLEHAAEFDD